MYYHIHREMKIIFFVGGFFSAVPCKRERGVFNNSKDGVGRIFFEWIGRVVIWLTSAFVCSRRLVVVDAYLSGAWRKETHAAQLYVVTTGLRGHIMKWIKSATNARHAKWRKSCACGENIARRWLSISTGICCWGEERASLKQLVPLEGRASTVNMSMSQGRKELTY